MRFSPTPSRLFDRFGDGFAARAETGPEARASRPVLLAVDDDVEDLREISRELHKRYGEDYRVVRERSPEAALGCLQELGEAGEMVALVLADQWMAEMSGPDFLRRAGEISSTAKRALLVDWGDRAAVRPLHQAMSLGRIDYYVTKPYGDHDERFHRVISEFLYDWSKDRIPKFDEIRVVGEQWSPRSFELRDLLGRNGVLHAFHSSDSKEGRELLDRIGHQGAQLPVVVLFDGQVLVDPTSFDIADACGVNPTWDKSDFDLVVDVEAIAGVVLAHDLGARRRVDGGQARGDPLQGGAERGAKMGRERRRASLAPGTATDASMPTRGRQASCTLLKSGLPKTDRNARIASVRLEKRAPTTPLRAPAGAPGPRAAPSLSDRPAGSRVPPQQPRACLPACPPSDNQDAA